MRVSFQLKIFLTFLMKIISSKIEGQIKIGSKFIEVLREKVQSYMLNICSCTRPIFELACSINERSCPNFGLPTLYNKHIKQNKLSLESLCKNKFEIIRNFVLKNSPRKKVQNTHDSQIEFAHEIDRASQGYDFKIQIFNRFYVTEYIKSRKSSKSVFHFGSGIQKFIHGHNKKRFGFHSRYCNCFVRWPLSKEGKGTDSVQVYFDNRP